MSKPDTLAHELRTLADEMQQVYEHSTDWLRDEAVTLASSVDSMREAADTIESLRDRLQELQGATDESRYTTLFGTPERAARTLCDVVSCVEAANDCDACEFSGLCVRTGDYDALLEWLKGRR